MSCSTRALCRLSYLAGDVIQQLLQLSGYLGFVTAVVAFVCPPCAVDPVCFLPGATATCIQSVHSSAYLHDLMHVYSQNMHLDRAAPARLLPLLLLPLTVYASTGIGMHLFFVPGIFYLADGCVTALCCVPFLVF